MTESIKYYFDNILTTIKDISLLDVLDIFLLSIVLYFIIKFLSERRAGKLLVGIVLLIILQALTRFVGMNATSFILSNVFQIGFMALVIIFQPELRSGLEKVGSEPIKSIRNFSDKGNRHSASAIEQVASAAADLSATKTGALIVFERSTKLGDRILTGTIINSEANALLIKNIFFNKAPLHDGALIIRNGRLYAAGCLLPLSENLDLMKSLGTRHRAALGLSENSDAVVVVVSEETGTISFAHDGKLERNLDEYSLTKILHQYLDVSRIKPSKKSKKSGDKSSKEAE